MEPLAQLEAWQEQIAAAPGATTADLDVAKRLVRHGIEAAREIAELRERLGQAATTNKRGNYDHDVPSALCKNRSL